MGSLYEDPRQQKHPTKQKITRCFFKEFQRKTSTNFAQVKLESLKHQ